MNLETRFPTVILVVATYSVEIEFPKHTDYK